jgi:hypothetical protein
MMSRAIACLLLANLGSWVSAYGQKSTDPASAVNDQEQRASKLVRMINTAEARFHRTNKYVPFKDFADDPKFRKQNELAQRLQVTGDDTAVSGEISLSLIVSATGKSYAIRASGPSDCGAVYFSDPSAVVIRGIPLGCEEGSSTKSEIPSPLYGQVGNDRRYSGVSLGAGASIAKATVRWVCALLLLGAGTVKLFSMRQMESLVRAYDLLPQSMVPYASGGLPILEIVAGALLAAKASPGRELAAGLFLLFSIAITANLLRGRKHLKCGCFGSNSQTISWALVARNMICACVVIFLRS